MDYQLLNEDKENGDKYVLGLKMTKFRILSI
jgi:hypothetical protein